MRSEEAELKMTATKTRTRIGPCWSAMLPIFPQQPRPRPRRLENLSSSSWALVFVLLMVMVVDANLVPINDKQESNHHVLVKVQATPLYQPTPSSSVSHDPEEEDRVWQFTCFLSPSDKLDIKQERSICCQEIVTTAMLEGEGGNSQKTTTHRTIDYCLNHLAKVPKNAVLLQNDDTTTTMSFTTFDNSISSDSSFASAMLADYSLLLSTSYPVRSSVTTPTSTLSPWWSTGDTSSSSSSTTTDHIDGEESDKNETNNKDDEGNDNSIYDHQFLLARIHSELSETGGMHRELHHVVTIDSPPSATNTVTAGNEEDDDDHNETTTPDANVNLSLLLVLPEDFFMDMDDPVVGGTVQNCATVRPTSSTLPDENDTTTTRITLPCTIQYHLVEGEIVDIEQPAFDSPQHIVGIQVSFQFEQPQVHGVESPSPTTTSWLVSLQFATKIHTRYPAPISLIGSSLASRMSLSSSPLQKKIGLPAPCIVGGTWQAVENTNTSGSHDDKEQEQDHDDPFVWFIHQQQAKTTIPNDQQLVLSSWLSTTVAAGSQEDYAWVVVGTLMCSLIGAALTLRDLTFVSIWDAT